MKTTILYIRRLLAIILLLFYSYIGWSQTSTNYTFTNTTNGSLTDISSIATELLPANTDGVNYGALSEVTDIGFTFYFMSTAYTQFTATEDGAIRFGNSVSGLEGPPLWTANEPRLVIFGSDNKVGSNGSVRYAVIGDAPNRVLVVEWNNMIISYPNNSNPEAGDSRWQIRLHEGSGVIEYVYGYMDYVHNQGALSGIGFTSANTNNKLMYKTTSLTDNSVGTSAGGYNILSSQVTTTGIISGLS
ncbi:MAG: hypothetical protein Q8880_13145, partial [Bacteroidota bacterium]|nr:hypothetical protein [Bacteroidota bacterium]